MSDGVQNGPHSPAYKNCLQAIYMPEIDTRGVQNIHFHLTL